MRYLSAYTHLLTRVRTHPSQDVELDQAKVKAAIKAQKKQGSEVEGDDRKRKYNSGASHEVSAEEMEAYHRMKKRDNTGDMADPMANFKDDEDV